MRVKKYNRELGISDDSDLRLTGMDIGKEHYATRDIDYIGSTMEDGRRLPSRVWKWIEETKDGTYFEEVKEEETIRKVIQARLKDAKNEDYY